MTPLPKREGVATNPLPNANGPFCVSQSLAIVAEERADENAALLGNRRGAADPALRTHGELSARESESEFVGECVARRMVRESVLPVTRDEKKESVTSCPLNLEIALTHGVSEGDDLTCPTRLVMTLETTWQAARPAVSVFCQHAAVCV
ncbi:hypothetical protein BLNAU_11988 [Blattamonas nauphoetae]|uniref:Uncharacterized protein n=1 Tax=Blattamonas nauphoetae TaxID=2049346 RepID=A0ABQ9XML1_9EUKA|nr:hypothetical protein BLNAU_11988 [Blattamonas nauphoetae]